MIFQDSHNISYYGIITKYRSNVSSLPDIRSNPYLVILWADGPGGVGQRDDQIRTWELLQ